MFKGLNVHNQKDESVGEITDIAIKGSQVDTLTLKAAPEFKYPR